ncbi:unnamed protein product, partial [Brachionus calyciflorus]
DRLNWIPINPINVYNHVTNFVRTQFPLRLAYALTIHKSQGQTIDKAAIDLGKKETSLGLTFVALSMLKNFNRITKDFETITGSNKSVTSTVTFDCNCSHSSKIQKLKTKAN